MHDLSRPLITISKCWRKCWNRQEIIPVIRGGWSLTKCLADTGLRRLPIYGLETCDWHGLGTCDWHGLGTCDRHGFETRGRDGLKTCEQQERETLNRHSLPTHCGAHAQMPPTVKGSPKLLNCRKVVSLDNEAGVQVLLKKELFRTR